jgi:hypothetical protein
MCSLGGEEWCWDAVRVVVAVVIMIFGHGDVLVMMVP